MQTNEAIKSKARRTALRVAKAAGAFALSRWLTRKGLRILCYHGIWLGEGHYSNFLFMSAAKFKRRIELIKQWRIPVMSLDEAVRGLEQQSLPKLATVITIDDGWFGTFKVMVPELVAHGLPATIYSTSYYTEKQLPVFGVALDYLLSRSESKAVDLGLLGGGLSGQFQLATAEDRDILAEHLEEYASRLDAYDGFQLLERLSKQLDVEFQPLVENRVFHLMTCDEIKEAARKGIDIQLHTHRHRFPLDDPSLLQQELQANRSVLNALTAKPLRHFCYPSGVWSPLAFSVLQKAGIESAVTTEQGLNFSPDSRLHLRRISDGEYVDELEFEAELTGFAELVRKVRRPFRTPSHETDEVS